MSKLKILFILTILLLSGCAAPPANAPAEQATQPTASASGGQVVIVPTITVTPVVIQPPTASPAPTLPPKLTPTGNSTDNSYSTFPWQKQWQLDSYTPTPTPTPAAIILPYQKLEASKWAQSFSRDVWTAWVRSCEVGEIIQGKADITDQLSPGVYNDRDSPFNWYVVVLAGETELYRLTGNCATTPTITFRWEVKFDYDYFIRVGDNSPRGKNFHIEISPLGWTRG